MVRFVVKNFILVCGEVKTRVKIQKVFLWKIYVLISIELLSYECSMIQPIENIRDIILKLNIPFYHLNYTHIFFFIF